ncbi:MAG: DUF4249 domain-containing protein [Bacteroidales bacterium]|nr:DUF4249 domain-containing protein [Bacteroidales bacterium]
MKQHWTYGGKGFLAGLFFIMAATLMMLSCDDQIDWNLKYQEVDLIVVEGKITNEKKEHEVRLTRPLYEMNGTPEPVTGAQVEINDGTELHSLTEDPERPGIYKTDSLFAAVLDQYYQLRILYGTKRITAVTYMREVTPFQDMNVYRVQSDPLLLEVYISNSDKPAIVRLELDWSHLQGYDTLPDSDNHAVIYHYSLNGVDVNKIFKPAQEHVRFPSGTVVFREKESVNGFYGEFLRGVLSETNWRGGMFDVLPGNARTNMEGRAIGFFTAADVLRDTVVVK